MPSNEKWKARNRRQVAILLLLIALAIGSIIYLPSVIRRWALLSVEIVSADSKIKNKFLLEIASTVGERTKGLMFVKSLPYDEGMLFVFQDEAERAFWMKDTFIPLDMIFLDKEFKVVSISHQTKPFDLNTYKSNKPAMYVIELNGGVSKEKGITEGSVVKPLGPIPRGLP